MRLSLSSGQNAHHRHAYRDPERHLTSVAVAQRQINVNESAGRQTALVAAGLVPDQKVDNFTVDEVVAAAIKRIREQDAASAAIREAQSEIAAFDIKQATVGILDGDDLTTKEK